MKVRVRAAVIGRGAAVRAAALAVILAGGALAQTSGANRLPGNVEWVRGVEHAATCSWLAVKTESNPEASNFSGCIRGADQLAGPIRVQMQAAYAGQIAKTNADKSGEFFFKDVSAGDYILLATQKDKVVAMRAIRVPSTITSLVLDLGPVFDPQCWTCGHYGRASK
jgi:hypothetical protein